MTEERRRIWEQEWNRVNDGQLLNMHYETHKETQRWRGRFVRMGLIVRRAKTTPEEKKRTLRAYKKTYYIGWRNKNKEKLKTYAETYWRKKLKKLNIDAEDYDFGL
jgi:hypothetical protein